MNIPEDIVKTLIDVMYDATTDHLNPDLPAGRETYMRECFIPQLGYHGLTVVRTEPEGAANNEPPIESPVAPDFAVWVHIAFDRNSRPRLTIEVQ